MRLIDADALINRIVFHSDLPGDQKEVFEDEINAEPPAQPEITRCKDCVHYYGEPGNPNIICFQMHEDDFCSYAERREG